MNDDKKLAVHAEICDTIKGLYQRKNADYGDSFGKARKVVPNYTLGKLYDKFMRYMNLSLSKESKPHKWMNRWTIPSWIWRITPLWS